MQIKSLTVYTNLLRLKFSSKHKISFLKTAWVFQVSCNPLCNCAEFTRLYVCNTMKTYHIPNSSTVLNAYSGFRRLCKFKVEPQCSTIKGSVFFSTCSTETVSLYNYSLWHWAWQVDLQRCVNSLYGKGSLRMSVPCQICIIM